MCMRRGWSGSPRSLDQPLNELARSEPSDVTSRHSKHLDRNLRLDPDRFVLPDKPRKLRLRADDRIQFLPDLAGDSAGRPVSTLPM